MHNTLYSFIFLTDKIIGNLFNYATKFYITNTCMHHRRHLLFLFYLYMFVIT